MMKLALPSLFGNSHAVRSVLRSASLNPVFTAQNDCFVRFGEQSKEIGTLWFEKIKLGHASYQLGDYAKAYRYYSGAKELSDPDKPEQVVKTLTGLGKTCGYLKRCEEGDRYLKKALQIYPEAPTSTAVPKYEIEDALGKLNILWAQQENSPERLEIAGQHLQNAFNLYLEKHPVPKEGLTVHWQSINGNRGLYHKIKEETDEAIGFIEEALDASQSLKKTNTSVQGWYHRSLARLYQKKQADLLFYDDTSFLDKIQHHLEAGIKVGEAWFKASEKNAPQVRSLFEDLADVAMLSGFGEIAENLAIKTQQLPSPPEAQ